MLPVWINRSPALRGAFLPASRASKRFRARARILLAWSLRCVAGRGIFPHLRELRRAGLPPMSIEFLPVAGRARRARGSALAVPLAILVTSACASHGTRAESAVSTERAASEPQDVGHTVVTDREALAATELLERADRALEDGRLAEALADYQRLVRVANAASDADAPWHLRAWFGVGTAEDLLGHPPAALDAYLEVLRRFPRAALARIAAVRAVRLLVHLERIPEAAALARRTLDETAAESAGEKQALGPLEEIALHGAIALDLVARGDDVSAMRHIGRAQLVVERHGFDRADTVPRDLAQLFFALGEVRRVRAERIVFDPPPDDFPARLEERCQLLLDAQSAYSDAMRAHDAHWSAMAGFRVGELYQKLHEELMRTKPPPSADTPERRALFEGAMRLRYSVLLEKARTMLEHTLRMIERTGHVTPWEDKAKQALRELHAAIAEEEAALDRLPYSRAELQAALDELGRRGAQPTSPGPRPGGPTP